MPRSPADPELARLLSRREGPSVLERERVLASVLASVDPEPEPGARRLRWLLRIGLGAALPAAAALMLWLRAPPAVDELVARGAPGRPTFRAFCSRDAAPAPCTEGAVLAFEVAAPASHAHLGLFGRRADGTVVWYAPAPGQASAREAAQPHVLGSGARLDPSDTQGLRVYAVFSAQPLTREQLKRALGPELRGGDGLIVREQQLAVEPAP